MKRRIAVVTVGRSDYGIWLPVLAALAGRDDAEVGLIVSAAHLVATHGEGEALIRRDGHDVFDTVEMLMAADSPSATALSMGVGVCGFARAFTRVKPDLVMLLGDRFEMFAAASAAVPLGIPLLHLHGGEVTEGAMDERFRHAITKLSHLHCVATPLASRRVRQMGEESWRVHVTGAPGLDALLARPPVDRATLLGALGMENCSDFLLVTYHPVTTAPDGEGRDIQALLGALRSTGMPLLCTIANADPGGAMINSALRAEEARRPGQVKVVASLGPLYGAAMAHAAAMVGNSSSGVIEACSFGLPVLNVGPRQDGRERSENLLDCPCEQTAIEAGLRQVRSSSFREQSRNAVNVYGDGQAAEKIGRVARETPLDGSLHIKRFALA